MGKREGPLGRKREAERDTQGTHAREERKIAAGGQVGDVSLGLHVLEVDARAEAGVKEVEHVSDMGRIRAA